MKSEHENLPTVLDKSCKNRGETLMTDSTNDNTPFFFYKRTVLFSPHS